VATAPTDTVIRHLRRATLQQDGAGRTDAQLLVSFIDRKDEAAFEALVRRHGPMVFGVCRRVVRNHHDAEDAFQAAFLVLARKAASVRPGERLASWLHGVALRTAMKAKGITARRKGREKQVPEMPEPDAARQDPWPDLQPLLDQELSGLPENYRLPILLCDLEGKTIKEATRQLGWPQGTLAGRLARARKLLAKRLVNRGVVLSAGPLAAVVSRNAASAAVPASLMRSTVKAAAMISAGQATVDAVVAARVAILTEGVLKLMLLSKLKTVTAKLLLVALLCGSAGAIYQTQAAEQPKEEKKKEPPSGVLSSPDFPPQAADKYEYALVSRVREAGSDRAEELPKITVDEGQLGRLGITANPRNLLEKVVFDEKIKIGTFFECRARHLGGDKVRLVLSFEKNELDQSSVSEIRVLGHSVQAIQDVVLHEPVKIVFEVDDRRAAQRWLEITVDEVTVPALTIPPPPASPPPRKEGKK
jgi:RNA polymerase sigma factor (sigma-70 family)